MNSTIETLNVFPFVSIPAAELERIENLSQTLGDIQSQLQAQRVTMDERRSEIVQGIVTIVTTPTSQIISTLEDFHSSVYNYSQRLGALEERLSNFQISIGSWLTWVATLLTLILLWTVFSEVVLLVLSWCFLFRSRPFAKKISEPTC